MMGEAEGQRKRGGNEKPDVVFITLYKKKQRGKKRFCSWLCFCVLSFGAYPVFKSLG